MWDEKWFLRMLYIGKSLFSGVKTIKTVQSRMIYNKLRKNFNPLMYSRSKRSYIYTYYKNMQLKAESLFTYSWPFVTTKHSKIYKIIFYACGHHIFVCSHHFYDTGLSKSAFSNYYFRKLVFRLSVFYLFYVFPVWCEFSTRLWIYNIYNHCS